MLFKREFTIARRGDCGYLTKTGIWILEPDVSLRTGVFHEFHGFGLYRGLHDPFNDGTLGHGDRFARYRTGNSRSIGDLDSPGGDYVTFDMARDDDICRPDRAGPEAALRQYDGVIDFAVAIDFAVDLKVAIAGQDAGKFAALADKRGGTGGPVSQAAQTGITHASLAPEIDMDLRAYYLQSDRFVSREGPIFEPIAATSRDSRSRWFRS